MNQREVELLKAHARGEHATLEQIEDQLKRNDIPWQDSWMTRLVDECPRCDKLRLRAAI